MAAEKLYLVQLSHTEDDFGVYSDRRRGMFGTPLVYRGTLVECRHYIRHQES